MRFLQFDRSKVQRFGAIALAATMITMNDMAVAFASDTTIPAADSNLFNTTGGFDFNGLESKVRGLATWFFGIGTVYFISMVWKNGLNLAKSGDNPQARAQAQSALWANALGGMIFFGAALFASLIRSFATAK